ncbi:hypothetical protein, partial [Cystobacter fuscus]|uniref:hypothetical protein n=1 Tax=Cystobacter fuscus TaxID=43 RepID=UPI001B7FC84D
MSYDKDQYQMDVNSILNIGTQLEPEPLTGVQQTTLIRYQPAPSGGDYAVAIAAVDTLSALQNELRPLADFGDHETMLPTHELHFLLSWIWPFITIGKDCRDQSFGRETWSTSYDE